MTAKKLQEIALRLFAEKGYEGTSLAEIAGEIGIKKPSIYAHYPSKMDLFMAVVAAAKADYRQCWITALAASEGQPATERLRRVFNDVGMHFAGDRIKKAFWIRIWIFPPADCQVDMSASLRELNSEFIMEIAEVFRQGMEQGLLREGPPKDLAHALFSLLIGFLMRAMSYERMDHQQLLLQTWDFFESGIKAPR